MKTARTFISFFLIFLCLPSGAYAFERPDPLVSYVMSTEEGVFLKVANNWIATEALQATGEGIFVLVEGEWMTVAEALENPKCLRATWICDRCGFVNYDGIEACGVCGKLRPRRD
jgi:hypothetical protein